MEMGEGLTKDSCQKDTELIEGQEQKDSQNLGNVLENVQIIAQLGRGHN